MVDLFSKEFELMCYVKDTRALQGICTYNHICEKFSEKLAKKLMIEENLIGYDDKTDGLDWTELGWEAMKI